MFFRKHTEDGEEAPPPRKRRGPSPIVAFFQIIISIIIFAVLGVGLYAAIREFSGVDPLSLNPQSVAKQVFSSDTVYSFFKDILSYNPTGKSNSILPDVSNLTGSTSQKPATNAPLAFTFAIIADSHIDISHLNSALAQAKDDNAQFIIGIGDFSNVGTVQELSATRQAFDQVHLPYYVVPGDHDLWDSRNKKLPAVTNFQQIFGIPYQTFAYQNARFYLLYNTDDYLGLDDIQMQWIQDILQRTAQGGKNQVLFGIVGTPLYHPSSDHQMGRLTPSLASQASSLINLFKKYNVSEVFAGDTHFFSQYTEPKTGLKMTTVGAVTEADNPQTPRFVLVDVYEDGSYNIKETLVK